MSIEEKLQQMAVETVMSNCPQQGAWDAFMKLEPTQSLPEEFLVWEPFENWELVGLQDLVDDYLYTLKQAHGLSLPEPLPEKEEKYLNSGGTTCPHCGYGQLCVMSSYLSATGYHEVIECGSCGKSWKDIYQLVEVRL